MKRHRVCCLLWLLAACSVHEPKRPQHGERTVESAPESFFGIVGLTQTTWSGQADSDWGSSRFSRVLVHRAGRVVCTVPNGSSGTGEYGWHRDDAQRSLSSAQPVRFVVRDRQERQDRFPSSAHCIGYELPDNADCRQVFDRPCSHEVCTPNLSISPTRGTGTLNGHVTQSRRPVIGATVLVGDYPTMSDERGGFAVEAGPGTHTIEVTGAVAELQRVTVTVGDHEDVEVMIDIKCTNVADPACCSF